MLHRFPSLKQGDAPVVKDVAVSIPRVVVVAWFEGERSVTEVQVHVVKSQPVETRLECRLDTLGTMIRIPQLSGYEDLLPCNPGSAASCSQRLAYLPLVAVSLGAIEVTEANRQGVLGRAHRDG